MDQRISELTERIIRLDVAQEYRHRELMNKLDRGPSTPMNGNGSSWAWGWVKVPTAFLLPLLAFLLILALTGDPRAALKAARTVG